MKLRQRCQEEKKCCRSPCGERGLKFFDLFPVGGGLLSLPVRGAWIEIAHALGILRAAEVAPRAGSVD